MNLLNLKLAAAVVAAATVAGTSTYLVKEHQVDRLRTDYDSLKESQIKLTTEQQQATAAIQLRDDQIAQLRKEVADLPRLRGEVDKLNRDLAAMNNLQTENERLRVDAGKLRDRLKEAAADSATERQLQTAEFQKRKMDNINDLKILGLALRIYQNDHQDSLPSGLEDAAFQKLLADVGNDTKGSTQFSKDFDLRNFQQVYFGQGAELADGVANPNAVLVRQREPMVDPNGNRIKIYTLADGSVQTVTESLIGGSFDQFERNWNVNHKPILFALPQH